MKKFLKLLFVICTVGFSVPFLASGDLPVMAVTFISDCAIISGLALPYVNKGILGFSSLDARMIFENAKNTVTQAYGAEAVKNFVLTMSTLRLERAITAGTNQYTFPILKNDPTGGGAFNTEIRLKQQDTFIVSHVGFYLGLPTGATDTAWLPLTYESPFLTAANAIPMRALWSGDLQITINNIVYVYNWDLHRHYFSPITQQTAALGAASPTDQKRLLADTFVPVEPTVAFSGAKDNLIQVNLDAAPATFTANARIGLMFRGVNAQNSTPVS